MVLRSPSLILSIGARAPGEETVDPRPGAGAATSHWRGHCWTMAVRVMNSTSPAVAVRIRSILCCTMAVERVAQGSLENAASSSIE